MSNELQKMIFDYFEEYRKTKNELLELNEKIKIQQNKYREICNDRDKMVQLVENMKRIITHMIDNNCDPFAAKLAIDEHDQGNLWNSDTYAIRDESHLSYPTNTTSISYPLTSTSPIFIVKGI